jgi:hypothetical protein
MPAGFLFMFLCFISVSPGPNSINFDFWWSELAQAIFFSETNIFKVDFLQTYGYQLTKNNREFPQNNNTQ